MIGNILALCGVILIVVAVLKFLGVVAIASAAAGTLLVVGIILLLVSLFLFGGVGGVGPRRNGRVL